MQDKKIIAISLALVTIMAGAYFYSTNGKFGSAAQMEAIKAKAEKFINANLVSPGTDAKIKSITEESGVYKIYVSVGTQEIVSYLSKDGKEFFPQVISMEEAAQASQTPSAQNTNQNAPKSDKPSVELFVMSYCPYGLQVEKGILPVVDLLESKIDFQLKFVDYAMHGDKEIDENLRQYCIQKDAPGKLNAYLSCFIKQGDATACLAATKIDSSALASCVSQTDAEFKIKAKAADKSQWRTDQFPPFDIYQADNAKFGVQGSPTLVINGATVNASRDPQSLLNLVCSAFNEQPSECQQKLSTSAPAVGFGEGTGSAATTQCEN